MPDWSGMVGEDDLPTIMVNADALAAVAADAKRHGSAFGQKGTSVRQSWAGSPAAFSAPAGALDSAYQAMGPVETAALAVGGSHASFGAVLEIFASGTTDVKRQVAADREAIKGFHETVRRVVQAKQHADQAAAELFGGSGRTPFPWHDEERLVAKNQELLHNARTRHTTWETLRTTATTGINAITGGETASLGLAALGEPGNAHSVLSATVGALTGMTIAALNAMAPEKLLSLLQSLSPAALKKLLKSDPALVQSFWNNPPDASRVAAWWKTLSAEQQTDLVKAAPAIIGNLGGVPYCQRIDANAIQLAAAQKDKNLTDSQKKAIEKILAAMRLAPPGVRVGLIDFNLGLDNPLAAIAYGSLDTAQKVTWMVPGMNTTVSGQNGWPENVDMSAWGRAAVNLYNQQKLLDPWNTHGVVAWIGYDTPVLPIDFSASGPWGDGSVLSNDRADKGSPRLAAELDAYHDSATSNGNSHPFLSVIGHSYGTTTAADALAKTKYAVDNVVFVASAGIDTTKVPSAGNLHVDSVGGSPRVYITQAAADLVASSGRLGSNREDPADGYFGGQAFSSDGTAVQFGSDEDLLPTLGHDAIGTWPLPWLTPSPINAPIGNGYFDSKTESLFNIAATSTGDTSDVAGGLRTTDLPRKTIAPGPGGGIL